MEEEKVEEIKEETDVEAPLIPYLRINEVVDGLSNGWNKLVLAVKAVASGIFDIFAKALTNRRVRHLYKYGKGRVKTKNKNRIGQAISKLTKPFKEKKKVRKREAKSFMVIDDLGGE